MKELSLSLPQKAVVDVLRQCSKVSYCVFERHWTISWPEDWQTWECYWTGQNITGPQYTVKFQKFEVWNFQMFPWHFELYQSNCIDSNIH